MRLTLNRLEQPLRLAGQLEDPESGLHYNLRRHYDPATGRYLQPDPLGLAGGDEPYVYAEHDPLNKIDPTGEAAFLIPLGLNYGRCFVGCLALGALMGGGGGGGGWGCGAPPGLAGDCGLECLKPWNWGPRLPKGPRRPPPKPKPTPEPPCPCNSFPGDTLVHTPDGLRPIKELKAGEAVIAKAEWSGEERPELIEQVMSGEREVLLVHLTLATGEKITATANHPLRTAEGWRDAQLIKAGGQLDLKGSRDDQPKRAEVVKVEHELKRTRVYNLEVANAHTFFVGEEGVWVHNDLSGRVCWPKTPEEMDAFLGFPGARIPDLPTTPGRGKVVWQPCRGVKIVCERHPYHRSAPPYHRELHWHVDTPCYRHRRFLPGERIPVGKW